MDVLFSPYFWVYFICRHIIVICGYMTIYNNYSCKKSSIRYKFISFTAKLGRKSRFPLFSIEKREIYGKKL